MNEKSKSIKLAIIATGIGVVRRGFEAAALNWHQSLTEDKRLTVRLYGAMSTEVAHGVCCLRQNGCVTRWLRRLNLIGDGARLQQRTFFWGYLPALLIWRPDFIWIQEWTLAAQLQKWVRKLRLKTKIVFCDGAPVGAQACTVFDHVIALHQSAYDMMKVVGIPSNRLSLIPYVCRVKPIDLDRAGARAFLGYGPDEWVVLSVAAWNTHHKRIDYLIKEAAAAQIPRLRLLLCGQPEKETQMLKQLGEKLMPGRVQWITLPPEQIGTAYKAADVFVLASLAEGLGLVLIEAAFYNLPIICHEHEAAQFIFGDYTGVADLSKAGGLREKMRRLADGEIWPARSELIAKRFGEAKLVKDLVDLLERLS